jgi:hypothetical protein
MEKEIHRHHLLEIILWPNEDGTFRTSLNSRKRLIELGIYFDYKMTIPVSKSEHSSLHGTNRSEETRKRLSISKSGKSQTITHRENLSASHIGKCFGNKNPQWKPDGPTSKNGIRNRKLMENPEAYQEHLRHRREKRAQKRRSMLVNSSVIEEGTSVCQ